MARLPRVGDDKGTWGDILNDYLNQAHTDDGTLRAGSVGPDQLRSGAVTASALADGQITGAKIADGAITTTKMANLGTSNGIATLGGDGRLPDAQIPSRLSTTNLATEFVSAFAATGGISYDADGNVTSVTEGGITTSYTYDANGHIATETRRGWVRTWAYDADGNPTGSIVEEAA